MSDDLLWHVVCAEVLSGRAGHQLVRNLAQQQGPVACGVLGKTEACAGIHRHVREGKLTAPPAATVHQVMQLDDAQACGFGCR